MICLDHENTRITPTHAPEPRIAMIRSPSASEFLLLWLRIGATGFGGPAGQIALMHDELVERRGWIGEAAFRHALGYCMVLPGPEAQQLATYLGWLNHGPAGGIVSGLSFILPGLLLMVGLSWLIAGWGELPAVGAALSGLKPAVVVLVAAAAWRLQRRLHRHEALIAAAALAATVAGLLHFIAIIGLAALAGWRLCRAAADAGALVASPSGEAAPARSASPHRLLAGCAGALLVWAACRLGVEAGPALLGSLADFFTRAALVTFGGAYAVLPYVFDVAVRDAQWLSPAQMIDGLALGETTPGPLILVNTYIGFFAGWNASGGDAGTALTAALTVTLFTFLPSFAFILIGAPWVERSRDLTWLQAPLRGIAAAVAGLVAALGLTFATHVLWPSGWLDAELSGGLDLRSAALLLILAGIRWRLGWGGARLVAAGALLGVAAALAA